MAWRSIIRSIPGRLLVAVAFSLSAAGVARAQAPSSDPRIEAIQCQLAEQQREMEMLRQQLREARLPPQHSAPVRLPSTASSEASAAPAGYPMSPGLAAQLTAMEMDLKSLKDDAKKKDGGKKDDGKQDDGWKDMSDEKWTVKLGGHVQLDYILWANASPSIVGDTNYFEFRRLRLNADGTGYGVFDFRLQMTLEPESVGESTPPATSPEIKDAYFSVNDIPWLGRFRIGNFFVPFGLEQVTNDTNTLFLERSIPTQGVFTADREPGVALYNHSPDLNMTWTTGIFIDNISDSLKERIDDNMGYRIAGRFTWLPYYDEPSKGRYLIHTGAGVLYTDDHDNAVRFRARPEIHEGPRLIDSGIMLADTYISGNVEFAIVCGSLALQSEAYLTRVNLNAGDPVYLNGAYLHCSYFLTGENRIYERFGQHGAQFARAQPYSNAFWVRGCHSPGAVELKARWAHLDENQWGTGQYNDLTVGFNWYWSDRTRILFDWIHPLTSSETVFGATTSDIIGMRFDWNW